MSRLLPLFAASLLLALSGGSARAAGPKVMYKCLNDKGEIYYSDHFVPEQCTGGGSQINDQGLTVKKIERQMTPEERAAAEQQKRDEEEQRKREEAQRKADNVLLQSFVTEEDLTRAHEKEVRLLEADIKAHQLVLKSQERDLTDMLAQAADAERTGQPVAPKVLSNIGVLRKHVEAQRALIQNKQARRGELNTLYETQLKRFRELKKPGAPQATTSEPPSS
jgi:hypothetical protein